MTLELYYRQDCPFSAKVRDFISRQGLQSKIEYHDVAAEPESDEKLFNLTQDEQVPCLVVDGQPLLESENIIHWLNGHKKELQGPVRHSSHLVTPDAD